MENINKIGIGGRVKAWITRLDGRKELVFDSHNAVDASYAADIVDAYDAGMNHALDNLFNGVTTPPPNGEDGIAFYDTTAGAWHEMIMDAPTANLGVTTIKGTHLCAGADKLIAATATHVLLGHNWLTTAFVNPVANVGAAWTAQAVLVGETLTIEWTITHAAT